MGNIADRYLGSCNTEAMVARLVILAFAIIMWWSTYYGVRQEILRNPGPCMQVYTCTCKYEL